MPGERLSETEICDHLITPALQRAGWLLKRMRRE
jgi:type I site-specific restriction endonuclease